MARLRLALGLVGLLAVASGAATCNLVAGLSDYEFSDGGLPNGVIPCAETGECDDENACTTDACVSGGCVFTAMPDGPSSAQITGDCKTILCNDGVASDGPDDGDLPDDDNDCTADTCNKGVANNTPKPDGLACLRNGANGTCDNGTCVVACGPGLPPCDDQEPCTTDSCDEAHGKCEFVPLDNGTKTPGVVETAGDCQGHVCASGHDVIVSDDSDFKMTATDCDEEKCVAGAPSNPPLPLDAPCFTGGGAVCDGVGACVACNSDQKCMGPSDDCQHPGCVEHACKAVFTAVNTVVAPALQVPGDCQAKVCDGAGGITTIVDDGDSQDDGNPCTDDQCVSGVLKHPPSAAGTACGMNGMVCSGAGACVSCVEDLSCVAPATCGGCGVPNTCCCLPKTCSQLGVTCGIAGNGCGNQLQCNNAAKDGAETDVDCGGTTTCATKCALGKACTVGADCLSGSCADGVCCDGACGAACQSCNQAGKVGMCSPILAGLDLNPANACAGNNTCVNGNCKKVAGTACAANAECASNACADGVCCNNACNGTCRSCSLAGSVGTCTNVPANQQDPIANVPCIGTNVCDGNAACKKANGQICAANNECVSTFCVDGVCCNGACNVACNACNLAGNLGACSNIPQYSNDTFPSCSMSNTCDGAGVCLKVNGAACAQAADCASHKCVANVCAP